jgi:DNA-binding protein YbaB
VDALADIEGIKAVVREIAVSQAGPRPSKRERELADRTIEISAGAGSVRVRVNALGQVIGLDLTPEVFTDRDPDLLADLILGARAEAQRRAASVAASYPPEYPNNV